MLMCLKTRVHNSPDPLDAAPEYLEYIYAVALPACIQTGMRGGKQDPSSLPTASPLLRDLHCVSLFVSVQVPPARKLGGRDSPRRDTFQPGGRLVLPSAGLRLNFSFQRLARGGKVLTAVCSSAASSHSPCLTRPYHPSIHARARPRA